MDINKINIWDLGGKINVKVNPDFIDLINNRIKDKYKTKRNVYKEIIKHYEIPFSTFKTRMKKGYKYFIDLEILLNLCKILDIDFYLFQRNIIAYKTRRSPNYIKNPKLPIEINPLFDMITAHHIADGFIGRPNGRIPYFGYSQRNKQIRLLYIKKLESLFGEIYVNKEYHSKTKQVYCPSVFTNLFLKIYSMELNDFLENESKIPEQILNKDLESKLAFLLGIIIDEGHIDSSLIVIGLKNRMLLAGLNRICEDLNYITSFKEGKDNRFYLYITSKSLPKFYKDYLTLLNTYPEVNLSYKERKITSFIKRKEKQKIYRPGNKSIILGELSKKELTVNEIAQRLNMTRQGARYLIKTLINENKVKVKSIVKYGNYKYGLR